MLLTAAAASTLFATTVPQQLTAVSTRNRKVVKKWQIPGDPRGVAVGADGTIYVGLAKPQAVAAIDPKNGRVLRQIILDSAEIASTKELVTLRTNADRTRLFIANGSDESATILSLPDLAVLREITMEGEVIRDAVPDPSNRFLYLLGRRVHVFDITGERQLRTLEIADPMAIAASSNGSMLAVVATEDFGNAKATVVALFDPAQNFVEATRDPLQTDETIEAAMFADRDRTFVAFSRKHLFEKPVSARPARVVAESDGNARMRIDFGDLVNSNTVCLPKGSGPQIASLTNADDRLVYAERRCSASGSFSGSRRGVLPASLYGVDAYAVAFAPLTNTVVATEPSGFLTIYQVPEPRLVQ